MFDSQMALVVKIPSTLSQRAAGDSCWAPPTVAACACEMWLSLKEAAALSHYLTVTSLCAIFSPPFFLSACQDTVSKKILLIQTPLSDSSFVPDRTQLWYATFDCDTDDRSHISGVLQYELIFLIMSTTFSLREHQQTDVGIECNRTSTIHSLNG